MDPSVLLLKTLKDYEGPLDVIEVRSSIDSMLNHPFFMSGGLPDDVKMVQSCYQEFHALPHYGGNPKIYLASIVKLAFRWQQLGDSNAGSKAQRALLRYNSALLHSSVMEAMKVDDE